MGPSPRELCRRYGLTYVETGELDFRRRRCGRGFTYLDASNRTLSDKKLRARINALAIPSAWTDVYIASDKRAHIQAIGRDADGRLQYRYHPDWDNLRAEIKRARLLDFGTSLGLIRKAVRSALNKPGLGRKKLLAAIVRLMDRALLRPGHESYARKDGGRGAATLTKKDVKLSGDKILLEFPGKGGKEVKFELRDPLLARALRPLMRLGGRRLFKLPNDERPVTAQEVNRFLTDVGQTEITAKDFRTFRASASALGTLVEGGGKAGDETPTRALARAADQVSESLANTRSVARSSYIHPVVVDAYENGKLKGKLLRGQLIQGLNRFESALVRLLKSRLH